MKTPEPIELTWLKGTVDLQEQERQGKEPEEEQPQAR